MLDDLSGTIIKGYELRERIGQGGFGAVYRAYQAIVKREVAVKVILPEFANQPNFILRFEAEAQLVARLEHLHIVPLYDYWREPDGAYLVMRWLRGKSLHDSIKAEGAWSVIRTARLLDQIAAALAASHRSGIIHRDLKPANILLDEESNAYLTDFGIAKDLTASDASDQELVVGSFAYMSPEQIRKGIVSPQTDIYSLGIVLFETLTGERPFGTGTFSQVTRKHLNEPMPYARALRPELPVGVDEVIQHATQKSPADRYPDTLAMARDFRERTTRAVTTQESIRVASTKPDFSSESTTVSYPKDSQTLVVRPDIANPYKGLRAFEEADALDFFGREALVQRLVGALADAAEFGRFLAIIGPSGSGKSSVVRAGLIPSLRKGALPGSERWFIVDMLPGVNPFQNLVTALMRISPQISADLERELRQNKRSLLAASKILLPEDAELILLIDQFEELFTQVAEESERVQFLDLLSAVASASQSRVRIIVTLRADFYDRPLRYPDFGELVRLRTEIVLPLTAEELERAIVAPAQRVGMTIDTELVAAVIADVSREPGALPLLQYALTESFKRSDGKHLTLRSYRDSGGVLGALAHRADKLYDSLDESDQAIVRQLFLRLVTPGDGVEDTRRRVPLAELISAVAPYETLEPVLELFGTYRLLTFDHESETRQPTVEVAHEALIREWHRLRAWLDDVRDVLHMQRRLAAAADEWLSHEQESSFLADGARLQQFEALRQQDALALGSGEIAFVEASVEQREKRREEEASQAAYRQSLELRARNRLRWLVVVFAAAALIASVLTVIAATQSNAAQANALRADNEAQVSRSRELAIRSQRSLDGDEIEPAMLYALGALQTAHTFEARDSLLNALQRAGSLEAILAGHADRVRQLAYRTDGREFASVSRDGTIRLWDANTLSTTTILEPTSAAWSAAYSADLLATGQDDGSIMLWDTVSGQASRDPIPAHDGAVYAVAFSPDGRLLASAGADRRVRLWNVETGQPVGEPMLGHTDEVWSVAFSPDSRILASGSADMTIRLWDVQTQQPIGEPLQGHTNWVLGLAFSPDGALLASASADESAVLWSIDSSGSVEPLMPLLGHQGWVRQVAFSPDGRQLLTASADGTVRLWDSQTGESLGEPFALQNGEVWTAVYSPNGRRILSGGDGGQIFAWNPAAQHPLATGSVQTSSSILALGYSPDGTQIVTVGQDNLVRRWNTATHALLGEPSTIPGVVTAAYSRDGQRLAFGRQDGEINIWSSNGETAPQILDTGSEMILSLAFNPLDSRVLAVGIQDGTVQLWDLSSGARTQVLRGDTGSGIQALAYTLDGSRIIAGDQLGNLTLWDAARFTPIRRQANAHADQITTLALNPDASLLVTGSRDETLRLWDIDGTPVGQPLVGHGDWVFDAAFRPASAGEPPLLASGGADGSVILWDIESGQPLGNPLNIGGGWVQTLDFSPDGLTLASGDGDGNLTFWDASQASWQGRICKLLPHDLSADYLIQFGIDTLDCINT